MRKRTLTDCADEARGVELDRSSGLAGRRSGGAASDGRDVVPDGEHSGFEISGADNTLVRCSSTNNQADGFRINGTGNTNQIKGILNFTGLQTVSGATSATDALARAIAYVRGQVQRRIRPGTHPTGP